MMMINPSSNNNAIHYNNDGLKSFEGVLANTTINNNGSSNNNEVVLPNNNVAVIEDVDLEHLVKQPITTTNLNQLPSTDDFVLSENTNPTTSLAINNPTIEETVSTTSSSSNPSSPTTQQPITDNATVVTNNVGTSPNLASYSSLNSLPSISDLEHHEEHHDNNTNNNIKKQTTIPNVSSLNNLGLSPIQTSKLDNTTTPRTLSEVSSVSSIDSGLLENLTEGKKSTNNLILEDLIIHEHKDIYYALLQNVTKIRVYKKKKINIKEDNQYAIKLSNGLKCECFERCKAEDKELFKNKRPFRMNMLYTENERRKDQKITMDPTPLTPSSKSKNTYLKVLDLSHPYKMFGTEMYVKEANTNETMGRVVKKNSVLKTKFLIQIVDASVHDFSEALRKKKNSPENLKFITLYSLTKKKKGNHDYFSIKNVERELVGTITRKTNEEYSSKGFTSDYYKIHFLLPSTSFERTLILASVFLLDISVFEKH
ncbi:hypothetical protein ABK040_005114 [Willaertia magna]